MLRPLSFIAMRKQDSQIAALCPFGPSGGDKLIDNDLSGISEIAVLGFPDDEGFRGEHIIAIFIAEY
ncbi:hypothetical protein D3C80_2192160 [compost metagenome]